MRVEWRRSSKAIDGVFETIGRTPLVKFRNIPRSEGVKVA